MNIRTKILYIYQTLFCAFLSLFVACDDLERQVDFNNHRW